MTPPRNKIFLDIDGVINPLAPLFGIHHDDYWRDFTAHTFDGYTLHLSRNMIQAIVDLDCDITIVSTWCESPLECHRLLDFLQLPAHVRALPMGRKQAAVVCGYNLYAANVWIDDDEPDTLNRFKFPHLLRITPDALTGLTPTEISDIRTFCNSIEMKRGRR